MSVGKNVFWQTQLPGNLEKSFGPLRLSKYNWDSINKRNFAAYILKICQNAWLTFDQWNASG